MLQSFCKWIPFHGGAKDTDPPVVTKKARRAQGMQSYCQCHREATYRSLLRVRGESCTGPGSSRHDHVLLLFFFFHQSSSSSWHDHLLTSSTSCCSTSCSSRTSGSSSTQSSSEPLRVLFTSSWPLLLIYCVGSYSEVQSCRSSWCLLLESWKGQANAPHLHMAGGPSTPFAPVVRA